tara:strand:+ start:8890 stop:9936 length:1047 start_codon:yes stop_codon:yes gene_type:complete
MGGNGFGMDGFTTLMRTSGVKDDSDWLAVVLFVRNLLSKLSVYSDDKKAEIQRELFKELAKKDFSTEHFEEVVAMLDMYIMQTIGALELEEALTREKRSAAQLLNEMGEIIDTMHGSNQRQRRKLAAFKEHTVGVISSGDSKSVIVGKVRELFTELIAEFKEEARTLNARAQMLERTANFDPMLTELHNRRAFDAYLSEAVSGLKGDSPPLCLMMIDVDHFKRVNDTYGHQTGDDVLRALARILTTHAILYQGFTARYGGEELVVVTRNLNLESAYIKAEALRSSVEDYDFRNRHDGQLDEQIKFTVSIGVAQWREGWDVGQLISAADSALYMAKNSGRNRVCQSEES